MSDDVIQILRPLVTARRAQSIERVLDRRLKGVAVLLEAIYDHGNIAAVMRTCEALGVHFIHLVDLPEKFKVAKKVGQGAQKWLDIREHGSVEEAVRHLRRHDYRLLAADPAAERSIDAIDVGRPVALVFGNEHGGISPQLRALCDETYRIPMVGYSQSLNISCAAAISLFEATRLLRARLGRPGDLEPDEKARARELFYRRAVRRSELHLEDDPVPGA